MTKAKRFKVAIECRGRFGTVEYSEDTRELRVEHPSRLVVKRVSEYLKRRRVFKIPESQRLDDFRLEFKKPIESRMHMELALSSMHVPTHGVFVHWDKREERG